METSIESAMSDEPKVIDSLVSFHDAPGGELITEQTQYIPDEFITELRNEKAESLHTPAGEFHRVASIPVIWVEEMRRRGLDIYRDDIKDILKMLRKLEAEHFITTNKRV
jgi:hypothetical protein